MLCPPVLPISINSSIILQVKPETLKSFLFLPPFTVYYLILLILPSRMIFNSLKSLHFYYHQPSQHDNVPWIWTATKLGNTICVFNKIPPPFPGQNALCYLAFTYPVSLKFNHPLISFLSVSHIAVFWFLSHTTLFYLRSFAHDAFSVRNFFTLCLSYSYLSLICQLRITSSVISWYTNQN